MKCLRCGYCCINYSVVIVNDPSLGITDKNVVFHLGDGKPCKHLLGEKPGEYSCAIHNYEWYNETPCYDFGQIEHSPNDPCRRGNYIINGVNS